MFDTAARHEVEIAIVCLAVLVFALALLVVAVHLVESRRESKGRKLPTSRELDRFVEQAKRDEGRTGYWPDSEENDS